MKNRVGKGWAVVNVMEENAKIRAEVLQSLEGLSDDELNKKITDENWTIGQVLEHLYLLEEAVVKSVSHALKNGSDGPVETKPVYLAADRSKKRKAPAYLVPDNEYKTLEEMKEKLSRSRKKLLSVIAEAGEEALEKKSLPHPVFGPLNLKQWVEFVGQHEKRHLAQIEEIKEQLRLGKN